MIRIIDGVAYEGKRGSSFKVKAADLGGGHLEVTASRVTEWHEMDLTPIAMELLLENLEARKLEPGYEEEKAKRHAEQSARRAKRRVRQLCKVMGVDTLLTLTYRANQEDLALCKRHLKEFNRRLLRVLPDFSFVAAFERQERGAWHVHLATRRIPLNVADRNHQNAVKVRSYEVIRRVWRSVVGDLGGNIDVSRRKYHAKKTAAQIASYIAGYIVKEFTEGEKWSNRWTKYGEGVVPEPVVLGFVSTPLEAIEVAYSLLANDQRVAVARLDRWKDWFVLHAEGR